MPIFREKPFPGRKYFFCRGKTLDKPLGVCYYNKALADVAHLVERHLAKVEVASSSLVIRSIKDTVFDRVFYVFSGAGLGLISQGTLALVGVN